MGDCVKDIDREPLKCILDAMEGIPLAIVLMARRAQVMRVAELWRQWNKKHKKHTQLLEYGATKERSLSLENCLSLSIEDPRMDETAKRLLRLLGPYPLEW